MKGSIILQIEKYYNPDITDTLLKSIANDYNIDPFMQKTIEKSSKTNLFEFLIMKKYNDFNVFISDFLDFLKYNPKFNTMIKNRNLIVENDVEGVKFAFEVKDNVSYNFEYREINYLYDLLEDYTYFNQKNNFSDYIINTNYNEFYIEFYPNWHYKK